MNSYKEQGSERDALPLISTTVSPTYTMRIILCGFGVVGQSLCRLLESRDDTYSQYGLATRIVAVSDSGGMVGDPGGLDMSQLYHSKEKSGTIAGCGNTLTDMIKESEADVLIETTPSNYGNGEPGMSNIMSALKHGLHVISVNKGPLALAMPSLVELAQYNRVLIRFSGTVGGGTPILNYAKNSLRGERITSFRGILNGTTNYILSSMMTDGVTFEDALNDARTKGYVEADESLDLDGVDAAAKLVILANWVMGRKVTLGQVNRCGIRDVTVQDMRRATERDSAIKLVATCNDTLEVAPVEIPKEDPLCVNGTLNAISFTSEHSGTQTIIGRGAGGMETASSILRDLLDIRQVMTK